MKHSTKLKLNQISQLAKFNLLIDPDDVTELLGCSTMTTYNLIHKAGFIPLPKRQIEIITVIMQSKSHQEAADKLNVCRQYVSEVAYINQIVILLLKTQSKYYRWLWKHHK